MTGIRSVVFWLGSEVRKFPKSGQLIHRLREFFSPRNLRFKLPGTAEADIRVHIRRSIIQIQRESSGIRAIIPIAAA